MRGGVGTEKGQRAQCPLADSGPGATAFPPTARRPAAACRTPRGTYSSDSRSCSSLLRSRKQPSECMLSSTSGSMSSRLGRERICTFRGMGCSGSGSFLPPLWMTDRAPPWSLTAAGLRLLPPALPGTLSPAALSLSQPLHTSCTLLCPAQACRESLSAGPRLGAGLRWAGSSPPPSLAGPPAAATGKAGDEWEEKLLTYTICVSECALATRERNRKLVWREQGAHVRRPEGAGAGSTWGQGEDHHGGR